MSTLNSRHAYKRNIAEPQMTLCPTINLLVASAILGQDPSDYTDHVNYDEHTSLRFAVSLFGFIERFVSEHSLVRSWDIRRDSH